METKEISLDRFSLSKIKLNADGGVSAKWEQIDKQGALTYIDQEDKTSTKEPHPDLVSQIEILKPFLAKMWGYNYAVTVAESKEFKGSAKNIDDMKRAYNEMLDSITVTGISVRGEGAKLAVLITGKRKIYKKIYQPMNSGLIKIEQKLYGFENDLEDIVPKIIEEVYEYLFNGKCQNPTLFDTGEQTEPVSTTRELPKEKPARKRGKGEAQAQLETQ